MSQRRVACLAQAGYMPVDGVERRNVSTPECPPIDTLE